MVITKKRCVLRIKSTELCEINKLYVLYEHSNDECQDVWFSVTLTIKNQMINK